MLDDDESGWMLLGIRAFASAYSDLDLTTETDRYIEQNLKTLLERSAEFVRLPSIQVDIIGKLYQGYISQYLQCTGHR